MAGYTTSYVSEVQAQLNRMGYGKFWWGGRYVPSLGVDGSLGPQTRDRVQAFQSIWNPGDNPAQWLAVDGDPGPHTRDALNLSEWLGGLVSLHFRASETACQHCGLINVNRGLLHADEAYRSRFDAPYGLGLTLISATRCAVHNAQVGGAVGSLHTFGGASDRGKQRHIDEVRGLEVYSGLEISHDGWIVHGDVRHLIPGHGSGFSPQNPSIFRWPTTLMEMQQQGWVCQS